MCFLIFFKKTRYASLLNNAESVVALYVRKTPIGNSTSAEIMVPIAADTEPSVASFFPEISMT